MDVFFAGDAWTKAKKDAVLRELSSELGRRSLVVCHRTLLPAQPSDNELTLIAIGPDEVRIIPARLDGESAWQGGRTMRVDSLPEDARALAVALAADEVLRGRRRRETPSDGSTGPPRPTEAAKATNDNASFHVAFGAGAALRSGLFTGEGERNTPLAAGIALRAEVMRRGWGGSLGVVLARSSEWTFGTNRFELSRLPVDLSAVRTVQLGPLQGTLEAGLVLALLQLEYVETSRSADAVEAGARLGLRVAWGERIVPYVGAAAEVMPRSRELRLVPDGAVGHTASLWLGLAIGLEARLP